MTSDQRRLESTKLGLFIFQQNVHVMYNDFYLLFEVKVQLRRKFEHLIRKYGNYCLVYFKDLLAMHEMLLQSYAMDGSQK